VTDAALVALALRAMAILTRVGMIVAMLPIFGEAFTPAKIRVMIVLALTACLLPTVPVDTAAMPGSVGALALALLPEFMLGMAIGLTVRLVFAAVQLAGQMAGEQMGFALANVVDPSNSQQISITAQAYYLFALLFFLAMNGHHILIGALVRSFDAVPLFTVHVSGPLVEFFVAQIGHAFVIAVMIAAPIVVAMLLSNLALGLISKAVPQINIFIESFSIHIFLGFLLMGLTFSAVGVLLATQFARLDSDLGKLLQLLH
jgi:flagellar biosynthetic protein FliR